MACKQPWEQWGVPNCRLEPIGYASTSEQRAQSRVNGIVSLVSGTGGDGSRARYSVTTSGEIDRRWNLPVQGALVGTLRRQGSPNDAGETGQACPLNFYCVEKRNNRGRRVRADVSRYSARGTGCPQLSWDRWESGREDGQKIGPPLRIL